MLLSSCLCPQAAHGLGLLALSGEKPEDKSTAWNEASRKLLILLLPRVFDPMHDQKTGRDLLLWHALPLVNERAIRDGGPADVLMEKAAEGSEALESNLETNVGHGESA